MEGKSERSDWFFLGRDFTIRTVSTETVQAVYFFFLSKAGKFNCSLNYPRVPIVATLVTFGISSLWGS